MTSDDISKSLSARVLACGNETDTQVARVTSYDYQILSPSGSRDDKAVLATRVAEIRAESLESLAAHVRVPGAVVRAWWRVQLPLEVGFLGFGRDMPWSMSVQCFETRTGPYGPIGKTVNLSPSRFFYAQEPVYAKNAGNRLNRGSTARF